jgi:hypothetical protein
MSVIGSIATRRAWIGFSGRCPPAARALVIKAAPDSAGYPSDACPDSVSSLVTEAERHPHSSLSRSLRSRHHLCCLAITVSIVEPPVQAFVAIYPQVPGRPPCCFLRRSSSDSLATGVCSPCSSRQAPTPSRCCRRPRRVAFCQHRAPAPPSPLAPPLAGLRDASPRSRSRRRARVHEPLREAGLAGSWAAMQPWTACLPRAWAAAPQQLWAASISSHWHLFLFFYFLIVFKSLQVQKFVQV